MDTRSEPSPLPAILQHLRREPSRTWSIVITVFGDVVAPRGGSFWLGSLLEIFAAMEIGGGVVRTAMSRLATDGWLERRRVGRNSFYRLTERGRAEFAAAAARIYGKPAAAWDGRFALVLSDAVSAPAEFGSLAPGVWIATGAAGEMGEGSLHLQARADLETGRQVAARAWALEPTAEAYWRFVEAFARLPEWIERLTDLDALVARILLIHEYRRVALRDPRLPLALLPAGWAGEEARLLCASIYRALAPASERWLDRLGRCEEGSLPPAALSVRDRFAL